MTLKGTSEQSKIDMVSEECTTNFSEEHPHPERDRVV